MSRKVILYIAASIDGYISRENGDIDWLEESGAAEPVDYGFDKFMDSVDTVILGNKTYSQVMGWGEYPYKGKAGYVYSRNKTGRDENVEFTGESPVELINRLKKEEGRDIWLIGGAEIVDLFLKDDLIDDFILTIIPVILGNGISLFKAGGKERKLRLKESQVFGDIVMNHYMK